MGSVLLHAGAGKAGSSSIQAWLAQSSQQLNEGEIEILVARVESAGRDREVIRLAPHECGPVDSNAAVRRTYAAEGEERRALLESLFEQLEAAAARRRQVIVSSEALQWFFSQIDEPFLEALEWFGRRHTVRVAYYVRPQHSALEAGWRQWGFRRGDPPSRYLASQSRLVHYHTTYAATRRRAPSVSFEPRPFRRELLDGGDPATDFAQRFVDIAEPLDVTPTWSNVGLPLEVVNALRCAPPRLFWSSEHDNEQIDAMKTLFSSHRELRESAEIHQSRRVLQAYCRRTFEPGNRRLIEAMGWEAESLVPPVEGGPHETDSNLDALDELWWPRASEIELAALFSALERALAPGAASAADDQREGVRIKADSLLADAAHDVASAEARLRKVRADRWWRLSRRLAGTRAAVRGRSEPIDPADAAAKRLNRAGRRLRRSRSLLDLGGRRDGDGDGASQV